MLGFVLIEIITILNPAGPGLETSKEEKKALKNMLESVKDDDSQDQSVQSLLGQMIESLEEDG